MSSQWKAINENYKNMDGYKRVAWPPVSEERIVREFTPQPQTQFPPQQAAPQHQQQQQQPPQAVAGHAPGAAPQQHQQQPAYRATSYDHYQPPSQQQPPSSYSPQFNQQQHYLQQQQQQPQYQAPAQYQAPQQQQSQQPSWAHNQAPLQQQQQQFQPQQQYQQPQQQQQLPNQCEPQPMQYNSYSQPQPQQQHQLSQERQPSQQPYPQDYRGGSPGIITLRKEAPVSQKPSPVFTSQPAAVSYQGGSNMRGDLKWPPPEYKEQAVRENEERRKLAQGPVCRPRRINRDYTQFFAKNSITSHYPSYKVPPGTQHMYA